MATAEQIIIRRDKGNGELSHVSRAFALNHLCDSYTDPALALDAATETHPASSLFADYWPVTP